MTQNQQKILYTIILLVAVWLFGFILGRKTIKVPKPQIITEYVEGPAIHDSIPFPVPHTIIRPADTANIIKNCVKTGKYNDLFPEKTITEYIEITKDDTTAVIKDWGTKRDYTINLFDIDTLGKCTVNAEVQYNRITSTDYTYTPIVKTVTKKEYVVKGFRPYIGVGAVADPTDMKNNVGGKVAAGFFVKEKIGVQVDYQHTFKSKQDYLGAMVLISF